MKDSYKIKLLYSILGFFILFIIYYIVSEYIAPYIVYREEFIPTYSKIADAIYFLYKQNLIFPSIIASLRRVILGYLIGCPIGFLIGLSIGWSKKIEYSLEIPISFFRYTPALALVPLYILWFGIGELSKILLIATGACVMLIVSTYHGVRDIPAIYIKASKMLGLNGKILFSKVVIPASLPQIFDGLRVALASAWMIIVAAEIMGATEGLGYLLIAGRQFTNVSIIFFGIILIGIMVIIMDLLFKVIRSYVIKWIATY